MELQELGRFAIGYLFTWGVIVILLGGFVMYSSKPEKAYSVFRIVSGLWMIKFLNSKGNIRMTQPRPFPPKRTTKGYERRSSLPENTKAELAIRNAMEEVEDAGADERLTDAVLLLQKVLDSVSDYTDDMLCQCTSCLVPHDMEVMKVDAGDNEFCPECWKELGPLLKSEYEEMVVNGEIEIDK